MRIAVFTDAFPPQINGVVTHLTMTIPLLAKHHQIFLFAPSFGDASSDLAKSAEIYTLSSLPVPIYPNVKATLPVSLSVLNEIKKIRPDLIHFHTPFTVGSNGIVASKKNQLPLVGTFHTYFMEPEYMKIARLDLLKMDQSAVMQKILWQYSNLFYNRADMVLCPSEYVRQDLLAHGIDKPITVVSNGIDLDKFATSQKNFNIKLPKKYFLYVGRLGREKNLDLLLAAYKDFSIINHDSDLVLVGEGPMKDFISNFAKKNNIESRVKLYDGMDRNKLIETGFYQQALGFVTTSTSETQGITVLEAATAGLPIIATDSKAMPELVTNNGILCPPRDTECLKEAMLTVASDHKTRAVFSKNSRLMAESHRAEKVVAKLENIYQSLLK